MQALESLQRYEILAAQIDAIGALLEIDGPTPEQIIGSGRTEDGPPVILALLRVARGDRVDPLLMAAVCRTALALFRSEDVSGERASVYIRNVLNPESLLGYLGGDNYLWLVERSKNHNKAKRDRLAMAAQ